MVKSNKEEQKKKAKITKHKENNPIINIIEILLIILIIFIIGSVIVFFFLRYTGKKQLYQTAGNAAPVIPQNMQDEVKEEENITWQDGWIRYQDKIYAYNEDMITFLIMGIDQQGKVKTAKDYINGGQADALFLVACDPDKGNISVIAINRNTMTPIEVCNKDGNYIETMEAQITLQHAYGDGMKISCERTKDAISKLFYDLPIHGYCSLNMGAIPIINDELGGVRVTVLEDLTQSDKHLIEGENVLLEGDMAYWYLRDRHMNEFDSAGKRLERQKQYINAFLKKLFETVKQSPSRILDIYKDVKPYTVTDLEINEISYFASLSTSFDYSGYQMYSLKGETKMGEQFEEFYVDDQNLYELILKIFYKEVKDPKYGY